ncbi:nucleotidyltransferase domain-containing protein [Vibrio aquimaris]|uniref:Polymerase nucleotidyl transferase domain-containing protein n=1 Tax=Vibrio aquimaris TaxID=2587862 RepID=A0A5P9CIN0_9VIBR|nr:nucleotidyltransferase domain-containing protein [Vibrio aquimaris]QFT26075.1 hypothetical protein FIV01_06525 [Vibrio aquimaris]
MSDELNNGLDSKGFIVNPCSLDYLQPEFQPYLENTIQTLESTFDNQLHSVYLYGSVARGNAKKYVSDLDISLVLRCPIEPNIIEELSSIKMQLEAQTPKLSKIDFDPGYLKQVLSPDEVYHWQFWLKHCCCCVWGTDLSQHFTRQRPSINIALALNNDLGFFMTEQRSKVDQCNQNTIGKILAKKMLRTAYTLNANKDNSWHTELSRCADVVRYYYPNHVRYIELAMSMITSGKATVDEIDSLINGWGNKLCEQIELLESTSIHSSAEKSIVN